jgi:copper transport protein
VAKVGTGLAIAVLVLLTLASPASAHATLVSSDPADGARLDQAPDVVSLTFNEGVSADVGGLRVFAPDGERVDRGAVRVAGGVVAVNVADGGDGTYVVTYRVTSADGHPVRGGLVFAVGDEAADSAALGEFFDEGGDRPWEIVAAVLRALCYAGALIAAGATLFRYIVDDSARATVRKVVLVSAAVSATSATVALPALAALATGQGATSITDDGVLIAVLGEGVGWSLLALLVGLALVVVDVAPAASVAGAIIASASFGLSGHNRATDPAWFATIADSVHGVATAIWFGGTVALTIVIARHATGATGAVTRFSRLALVTVAVVVLSGGTLSFLEVREVEALTSTTYGALLMSKVIVVGTVIGLAAYNRFALLPALGRGDGRVAVTRLGSIVRLESIGMLVAVVATAVLVNVTPARVAAGIDGGIFTETAQLGDAGSVDVIVDPARVGRNAIHLYFFDPDGRPADIAEGVIVRLTLPAAGIGPIEREPVRAGAAHLQLDGDELAVPGTWTIEVDARTSRFDKETATVEVPIRA